MATKKTTYKPDAIDGDGDGIVQEGTEFEREVGTDLPEATVSEAIEPELVVEEPEAVLETPKPPVDGNVWVADEAVSYAVLAARFLPEGMKKHDYAKQLYAINKGKTILPGTEVKL